MDVEDPIRVDPDGHLQLTIGGVRRRLDADQLFCVVVVWDTACSSWCCWFTTLDRRTGAVPGHAVDEAVLQWLERLPGWSPDRFAMARSSCGLHLVWRGVA
jgi:hypothetical protein